MSEQATIAYFSMEIGLEPDIPTYAGGLGMLAGDTVRSAADQGIPMVAVSLLYRAGYFAQRLDATGRQTEHPQSWRVEDHLDEMPPRCRVEIEGRSVQLRAWRYLVHGLDGRPVPVFLLDTDLAENSPSDRAITHQLYGGDEYYRLCQEVVLGMGGVRMLGALGFDNLNRYHMNEGHAAMLVVELLDQQRRAAGHDSATEADAEVVRQKCVFTTHTPVAAGFDKFSLELARRMLGPYMVPEHLEDQFCHEGRLNMTYLALANSHYVNGVAKSHRETAQHMFAHYRVDSITNGVHAATWVCPSMQELYNRHIPGWRSDNASLRYALSIPREELWNAHMHAKNTLLSHVQRASGEYLDPSRMTLGFARRATQYKRFDLLFADLQRLATIAQRVGPLQLIYAGKAHPQDTPGKELIKTIFAVRDRLRGVIDLVYLEDYNMATARLLTAGSDLWLNTPQPPLEASGTSGMKAALNGVPSLSVLDGWWIEGCIEGITGWAIGARNNSAAQSKVEQASSLYDKLENVILPAFYHNPDAYLDVMRHAIALNGSFFNTERMIDQYVAKAYIR